MGIGTGFLDSTAHFSCTLPRPLAPMSQALDAERHRMQLDNQRAQERVERLEVLPRLIACDEALP